MLHYLALSCLVASAVGRNVQSGRIVGGSNATIEDFPYQLSLMAYGRHHCGASVISETWVLSAAHCLLGISGIRNVSVRAGTDLVDQGGVVLVAQRIFVPPEYDPYRKDYDLAVIELEGPLPLGDTIRPVVLAPAGYVPQVGAAVVVSGWGALSSGGAGPTQLQAVTVSVVANSTCAAAYAEFDKPITDHMFCAADVGKDSCQGDSGGAAVEGGVQIGIVSWGNGCALPGYPGVYSSVGSMRDWITEVTGV